MAMKNPLNLETFMGKSVNINIINMKINKKIHGGISIARFNHQRVSLHRI
jgi:hypothetical protein